MENYNTNTEYHKYTGSFQVLPKKNHPHLKCQFPPKTPILPKSLLYKHSEKWLSPSPPSPLITQGGSANYRTMQSKMLNKTMSIKSHFLQRSLRVFKGYKSSYT